MQRLRLAARAVEGEHQEPAQSLLVRMGGDEQLELTDQLGVEAELELGLEQVDLRGQVQLAQPPDLVSSRAVEDDVGKRRSPPKLERLSPQLHGALRRSGARPCR